MFLAFPSPPLTQPLDPLLKRMAVVHKTEKSILLPFGRFPWGWGGGGNGRTCTAEYREICTSTGHFSLALMGKGVK